MALTARPVDPRDIAWEDHEPVFRVHLYTRGTGLAPDEVAAAGWSASEWEITGADMAEVLAWAEEHTPAGGIAEVWVVVAPDGRGDKGAIRLSGHDPNATSGFDEP